ncbi:MAG: endonuclease/exonuclease/phosphatase family protein [Myxococcales bacterium]
MVTSESLEKRKRRPRAGTRPAFFRPSVAPLLNLMFTAITTAGPCCLAGATVLGGCGDDAAAGAGASADSQPVSVMTRNLYLGAELSPLFFAPTVPDLATRAAVAWNQVKQSNFPERAVVLAGEIADAAPDVVALQEVTLFRTQIPGDWQSGAAPNATTVELDFLQLLLQALDAGGAHYQRAAAGTFTDVELPATDPTGASFDVRLSDRNVILVRDGLTFTEGPAAAFQAVVALPVGGPGGATLTLTRGYVSADVRVGSRTARVVDSHLEVSGLLGPTQEAQGRELTSALASYGRPLILTGDFNSPADGSDTATYMQLTSGAPASQRFRDAWQAGSGNATATRGAGATCCLDLTAPQATPTQRIDLVLCRGEIRASDARVIPPLKTPSGLWPSDHLGVYAQLDLP